MNDMEKANNTIEQELENKITKNRFDAAKGIVLTGWVLLIVMSMGIVGTTMWMWISGQPVPETLANWGSMVLGFLFGAFIGLLKDFISGDDSD